jgi:predicted nucleic acid-binding protein
VIEDMLGEDFTGRILPFDSAAAVAFAEIAATRRQAGRPIAQADAQIAAIARSRGAALATRNVPDFEECGIA